MKLKAHATGASVAVGAIGVTLLTGGTAYAYWSASGTGSSTATAGTATAISASPATVASGLYPGATGVAGLMTVSNPNPFPVKVSAATPGTITADSAHVSAGCITTGVTTPSVTTTLPLTVPAATTTNGVVTNGTANIAFTVGMDNTSSSPCQGATFTIPFSVTAAS